MLGVTYGWNQIFLFLCKFSVTPVMVPWSLHNRWLNCIKLTSFFNFKISHIYRKANFCANNITFFALGLVWLPLVFCFFFFYLVYIGWAARIFRGSANLIEITPSIVSAVSPFIFFLKKWLTLSSYSWNLVPPFQILTSFFIFIFFKKSY